MKKQKITLSPILITLGCFAFLSQMHAVSPTPDGCYPDFTTAEGCNALQSLTSGAGNTGVGWRSLFSNSTGSFNTGIGAGALILNNGDNNTAVGTGALLLNTAGSRNTAVGEFALQNNTGNDNTALGVGTGTDPQIGNNNVYIGDAGFPGDTNVISIGGIAAGGVPYDKTFIGGVYGGQVSTASALPVYVDIDGHLGTNLVNASGKNVRTRNPHAAQPQAKLNEFQNQQKRNTELEKMIAQLKSTDAEQAAFITQLKSNDAKQEATIAKQQRQIDALTADLQRVSARLEGSRPATQMVVNP